MSLRIFLHLLVLLLLLPSCREEPIDGDKDGFEATEDCDDGDDTIFPGAEEICGDTVDNNCDGFVDEDTAVDAATWYADVDGDGYGEPDSPTRACEVPSGFVADNTDCDDGSADNHPGADEVCGDSIDNNCDALIDDLSAVDAYTWYEDVDGDNWGNTDSTKVSCTQLFGYVVNGGDCDDTDAAFNPSAPEIDCEDPNDYNCDGSVGYADADVDGFPACDDCDDANAARNADVDEVCDDIDNDCDEEVDEDSIDAPTWYADADGDTHGGTQFTATECEAPVGYVASSDDCNDLEASAYPGNTEVCDGVDNDCDTIIDESDAADATTWYADVDGDGDGDSASSTVSCEQPSGYVEEGTDCDDNNAGLNASDIDGDAYTTCDDDCDDSDANSNPGATEYCNNRDNDCDGEVDEDDAADAATWYADSDGDGFGEAGVSTVACDQPSGYVSDGTDCDDTTGSTNPSNFEFCDGADNDCDGTTDESDAVDADTWYIDADGDGYGDEASTTEACAEPSGYVAEGDAFDCNDQASGVSPGSNEICGDGVDNDCNGTIDEDEAADATTWYLDADGDGFGFAFVTEESCAQPSGYVADGTDCDDNDDSVYPTNTEVCDTVDNDCDGTTDEPDASDVSTWYADADSDGYGDLSSSQDACYQPTGYVLDGTDCDDNDGSAYPTNTEVCDTVDNDCDGTTDEPDASDVSTWYADTDTDGYGDETSSQDNCYQPTGYVLDDTDCDDTAIAINPNATEVCDTIDNDCDGTSDESDASDASTWYADTDSDGYGDSNSSQDACNQPSGYVSDDSDCDDSDNSAYPTNTEVCDTVDNDCDGTTDEPDASDVSTWYADADGDGYGDETSSQEACSAPSGYVSDDSDCDDASSDVNPSASETCDSIDNDCDGTIDEDDASDASTWYADADTDGYGDATSSQEACSAPSGYLSDNSDCDDASSDVNPSASETCDAVDNDCDGEIDESDATDASTFYADADGDGYGDETSSQDACSAPSGYVSDDSDCNDLNATIYPYAGDTYGDGVDSDCDDLDCEAAMLNQVYFLACSESGTYDNAVNTCQNAGYDGVAAIYSSAENSHIYSLQQEITTSGVDYWIGLTDNSGWHWPDGTALSYSNWMGGEPNNGAELCACMYYGAWADVYCSTTRHGFYCDERGPS